MRNAYIFRAALYCEACGELKAELFRADNTEDTGDSDDFPQGPFPSGGGEADSPQHCDQCGLFLENPLTDQGRDYVRELIDEHKGSGRGTRHTLQEWANFYGLPWGHGRVIFAAAPEDRPRFYHCGICEHYHPAEWNGDCRDDQARHNPDELDARYGPTGWDEVPMPDTGAAEAH